MANTIKVLAQSIPPSTTLTDVYTVPASTTATVSTIVVCNTSAVSDTFRVSVAVAGAADETKQYLYYDVPIPANDTFAATLGVTLAATDVIRAYSNSGDLAINIYGVEVT